MTKTDTHEEIQRSQVAQEASLKPGLEDKFPSYLSLSLLSHMHTHTLTQCSNFLPLNHPMSFRRCFPLLQSFSFLSFSLYPEHPTLPSFSILLSSFLFLQLCALIFLPAPPLSLYHCVVSQALRVLCIPQTQCHPFILHQETLTPII